jgi:hypothetical protein
MYRIFTNFYQLWNADKFYTCTIFSKKKVIELIKNFYPETVNEFTMYK